MKKLMAVLGAALAAGLSFADDFTWVGPSGGDYAEPTNWEVNGETATAIPGKNDHAIFDPGEGQTLIVTNLQQKNTIYIRDISILSGTLKLLSPRGKENSDAYTQLIRATDDVTNTLYVAEGALFYTYFRWYPTTSGKGIVNKTGKGKVELWCNAWIGSTSGYRVDEFIISEGTVEHMNRKGQSARHWTVLKDGELLATQYSLLHHGEIFHIEKGGKVTLGELESQYGFSGLEGDGELTLNAASGNPFVNLNLNGGPYRWAGTFTSAKAKACCFCTFRENTSYKATDEMRHFPIVGSDQYADFKAFYPGLTPEFEPGVGEFTLAPLLSAAGTEVVTADTNGAPIVLRANLFTGTDFLSYVPGGQNQVTIAGPGEWWPRSGTTVVTGNQVRVTGKVGVPAGATLQFGNRTDAAADFTSFPFALENKGTMTFANVASSVTIGRPFQNAGTVNVHVPAVLTDYSGTGTLNAYSPMTLSGRQDGGSLNVSAPTVLTDYSDVSSGKLTAKGNVVTLTGSSKTLAAVDIANGGHLVLDGPDVAYCAAPSTAANTRNVYHLNLKAVSGRAFPTVSDDSLIVVTNGAGLYFYTGANVVVPNLVFADGARFVVASSTRLRGGTDGLRTITLDGGEMEFTQRFTTYEAVLCNTDDPNPENLRLCIGPKGGALTSRGSTTGRYGSAMAIDFNIRVESGVEPGGEDGGLAVDCGVPLRPTKLWSLTGPAIAGDAMFCVRKSFYDLFDDGKLFGSGDFVMDTGAWFNFNEKDEEISPRLAWGDGKKLIVRGAARLDMDNYAGAARTAELALTVGPDGATQSSLAADKFGVLQLVSQTGKTTLGDKFKMAVNGGVDRFADGRTKIPVVWQGDNKAGFVAADDTGALTPFANYTTMEAAEAGSTVKIATADRVTLEAGTKQIAALHVALNADNTKSVTIPDGATLQIGNGTDAAPILFELLGGSNVKYLPFDGAGAIDFGTSPGLIVLPRKSNGCYTKPIKLTTRLSGQNGVAYIGVNSINNQDTVDAPNTVFTVSAANDYTGGTVIDMSSVQVTVKDALSTGDVVVKGSRLGGGAVVFACEGPFANNFTISRFGRRLSLRYGNEGDKEYPTNLGWENQSHGALEFEAVGTRITGNVDVREHSRISSLHPADGTEVAIFEGIVSGDRLEIVDSCPNGASSGADSYAGRRHKFVFCNDNTITGGVEVLNGATAVLRGANPSLGTGTITLADEAALRFENTAELDFTNKLYGAGTIQLGATKEVHFNGDISEFEGVIDLCGLRHEFSKVPPFAFTNTTGRATVAFKGGLGTVDVSALELTGEPKGYNLEIGAGTALDLGGKTLTVRRLVAGEMSQVVNGELVETNPKLGLSLIVR